MDSQNDVRLAELQKWETTSTGLPQITADISYNSWIQQQIILVPAIYLGGEPGEFSELAFGNEKTINSTLTVTQKIFDGSYLVALQASKVYLSISKNSLEKMRDRFQKIKILKKLATYDASRLPPLATAPNPKTSHTTLISIEN